MMIKDLTVELDGAAVRGGFSQTVTQVGGTQIAPVTILNGLGYDAQFMGDIHVDNRPTQINDFDASNTLGYKEVYESRLAIIDSQISLGGYSRIAV